MMRTILALGLSVIAVYAIVQAHDGPAAQAPPAEAIGIDVILENVDLDARRITARSCSNQISPKA